HKDKASGRRASVSKAAEALGGKLEALYYAFGDNDVVVILDLPDNVSASALSLAVSASGLVRTKTTPLLTVDETDQALEKNVSYRVPGGQAERPSTSLRDTPNIWGFREVARHADGRRGAGASLLEPDRTEPQLV